MSTERVRGAASSRSPWAIDPIVASRMAWVPHSARATTRACGYGVGLVPPCLGYSARFASVSGRSSITPSMAITRHRSHQAPGVAALATGTATRQNSSAITSSPRRARAWARALEVGTVHALDQVLA